MPQHNTSAFGRGWIPTDRDIGLPGGDPLLRLAQPFTPARRVRFLHLLASTGNVRRACHEVGVSPQSAYVHKRRDAAFAHGWQAALILARDAAEEVLAERALQGTHETIFYRGEAVGSRVRFDARLLLAHIARLDRHADQVWAEGQAATGIAARFDEYLAELMEPAEPAFAPPDDDPEAPPQWTPAQPTREEALLAAREAALYAFPPRVEDLPAETLAELDLDAVDPLELWPHALAHTQHAAETAAAEAWDAKAQSRLTALDTLVEQDETPLDPPHFHEMQMGRWQPEGLTEGQILPSERSGTAREEGGGGGQPPLETKSAPYALYPVNRVNLRPLKAPPLTPPSAPHRAGAAFR